MMKTRTVRLAMAVTLVSAVPVLDACTGNSGGDPEGPAYTTVLDEKPIALSPGRQTLELGDINAPDDMVVLKIPAGAVPDGVPVRARLVTGVPQKLRAPVGKVAVEILPATVDFETPVRARIRVPAPPPSKRYASVHAQDASKSNYVQKSSGRRVGLGSVNQPDSEEWEIDIAGGGVWGVGEHESSLGETLAGGGTVTDEIDVTLLDEEQLLYIGPSIARRMLSIPAATDTAPVSAQSRVVFQTTATQGGAPVIVQTIAPPPVRAGLVPLPQTVIRIVPPASAPETDSMPTPIRVIQPLPADTADQTLTAVNAPDDAGPWAPMGMVRPSEVPVPEPQASAGQKNVEYDLHTDTSGYWGVAAPADPLPTVQLGASPAALGFGNTVIGLSRPETVTITNSGTAAASGVTMAISGPNANAFALSENDCSSGVLAPQSTCSVTIAFTPATIGNHTASLIVMGGAMDITVALTGVGTAAPTVVLSPATVDFGAVVVGGHSTEHSVMVSWSGDQTTGVPQISIQGTHPAEFAITNNGCQSPLAPGASCTVTLQFSPTVLGMRNAVLSLSANPGGVTQSSLGGTGVENAALAASTDALNLGGVVQGQPGTPGAVVITNTGNVPTGPLSVGLGGDYVEDFEIVTNECTGQTLAAQATCTVSVRFVPSTTGPRDSELSIAATPGGTVMVSLQGIGLEAANISFSPSNANLGSFVPGETSPVTNFTLHNGGNVPSGVPTITLLGSHADDFEIVSTTCNAAIAAQGNCLVTVRFTPMATGTRTVSLQATANPGGTANAGLSGTGLAPAALSLVPAMIGFGSTSVGTTSASMSVTVTNVGAATAGVPMVAIGGTHADAFSVVNNSCANALAGGTSCHVWIAFTPPNTGPHTATLQVSSTPGNTVMADLTGTGLAPAALSATPTMLAFGSWEVGTTSTVSLVTINNTGAVATGTILHTLSGPHVADFSTATTCTSLPAGGNCTISVTFDPSAAGTRTATLNVESNPGGTVAVPLSGTALEPATLVVSPTSHLFPNTQQGQTSAVQAFTISNTGAGTSGPLMVALGGTDATTFSIDSNTCTGSLTGGATCSIAVRFSPSVDTGIGPKSATLTVGAVPGNIATAALSGTVVDNAVFVSPNGAAGNPGTRDAPLRSIQDGVNVAIENGYPRVLVQTGTYQHANGGLAATGLAGLHVHGPILIEGGWNTNFSAVTGVSTLDVVENSNHVLWIAASNVEVRNLHLRGGLASHNILAHSQGGGILVHAAAPIQNILIDRVTVEYCKATNGGAGVAIQNSASSVTIQDSVIRNNDSDKEFGGGILILNTSNIIIQNTTIESNNGYTGALSIFTSSKVLLDDLTIQGNTSGSSVDGIHLDGGGDITLQNSYINQDGIGLLLNAAQGNNIANLVIDNNLFTGAQGDRTGAAIYENLINVTGHTLTNNRFDLTTITNLYYNGGVNPIETPATSDGLNVLNIPNHTNHNAAVASGNGTAMGAIDAMPVE